MTEPHACDRPRSDDVPTTTLVPAVTVDHMDPTHPVAAARAAHAKGGSRHRGAAGGRRAGHHRLLRDRVGIEPSTRPHRRPGHRAPGRQGRWPRPVRIEGLTEAEWVLADYGTFVVHVFHTETRQYYELERLWSDVPVDRVARPRRAVPVEADRVRLRRRRPPPGQPASRCRPRHEQRLPRVDRQQVAGARASIDGAPIRTAIHRAMAGGVTWSAVADVDRRSARRDRSSSGPRGVAWAAISRSSPVIPWATLPEQRGDECLAGAGDVGDGRDALGEHRAGGVVVDLGGHEPHRELAAGFVGVDLP